MQTKKYKVGFTTGVFDMLHEGHLNLLYNAKKQCDYLVVGVNVDEISIKYKNKKPIVTIDERVKAVKELEYVDEVIICDNVDKLAYYDLIRYDVLIAASDKLNKNRWKYYEDETKKIGVDIIYLPYTSGISSTILRNEILSRNLTNQIKVI